MRKVPIKKFLKRLSWVGLDVNFSFDRGVSALGLNVRLTSQRVSERATEALRRCLALKPSTVLDVGSGGGVHSAAFGESGARVTCIDLGTSIYAKDAPPSGPYSVVQTDFSAWQPDRRYALVWASHVLEHQRNAGVFIDKLLDCCEEDGRIAITVPFPHRRLWGGHLTLWTPGLLVYNVVLAGVDLANAELFYGYRETSLIFKPRRISLPELTFDNGDLERLAPYLPKGFRENTDGWF